MKRGSIGATATLLARANNQVGKLTGAIAQRFVARDVEEEAEQVEEQLDEAATAIVGELRAMRSRLGELEAAVGRRGR